jgi:hypothetical protein
MSRNKPQTVISLEDIGWLAQHRQSIERRNRRLKSIGAFIFYLVSGYALLTVIFLATVPPFALSAVIALPAVIFLITVLATVASLEKYYDEALVGGLSGLILAMTIALIYMAPAANIAQYPISMQVFYSGHPNITATQNCTPFSVSSSGTLNGQPINPMNTTKCNLPQSMAPLNINPFNCNINDGGIICTGTSLSQNITWRGRILNVSKR